jgi:hypothetical protein
MLKWILIEQDLMASCPAFDCFSVGRDCVVCRERGKENSGSILGEEIFLPWATNFIEITNVISSKTLKQPLKFCASACLSA